MKSISPSMLALLLENKERENIFLNVQENRLLAFNYFFWYTSLQKSFILFSFEQRNIAIIKTVNNALK